MANVVLNSDPGPLLAGNAAAGASFEELAAKIGGSIAEGSARAGASLELLGKKAEAFGVPFTKGLGAAGSAFGKFGDEATETSSRVQAAIDRSKAAQEKYAEIVKATNDEIIASNAKVAESRKALYELESKLTGGAAAALPLSRVPSHMRPSVAAARAQVGSDATDAAAVASGGALAVGAAESDVAAAAAAERRAKAVEGLSASFTKLGKVSLIGLSAGAAAVAYEAIKMGTGFESASAKIAGVTGQGVAEIKKLQSAFEGTAGGFQSSGQEMEGAFSGVAGQLKLAHGNKALGGQEALAFQSEATKLNEATGGQLPNTTKALASVMQVYQESLGHASKASDELFNASRATNVPLEMLANTATKLHGRLGDLGGGLTSVLALMEDAEVKGLNGGRGVLIFNQALERLTSGSKAVTSVLEPLGVKLDDTKGHFKGLPDVIGQLHHAYEGMTEAQQHWTTIQLFGKGATGEFNKIVQDGAAGLDKYKDKVAEANTVAEAAAKNQDTLTGQLHLGEKAVETIAGALGQSLTPKLRGLVSALREGVEWLAKHRSAAEALATVVAGVLSAAIGAFVGSKLALLISGIKNAAGAMVALVGTSETTGTALVASADTTAAGVDAAMMGSGIGATLVLLVGGAYELGSHWKEVMKGLEEAAQAAANFVIARLDEMIHGVNEFTNKISGGLIPAIHELKQFRGAGEGSEENTKYTYLNQKGEPASPAERKVIEREARSGAGSLPIEQIGKGESAAAGGIMGFFEAHGLSPAAAAGIAGNWKQESSLNPESNGPEGLGFAQWTQGSGRKAEEEAFAKSKHKSALTAGVQLEFAWQELMTSYKGTLEALKKKGLTAAEAAGIFEKGYEGPEKGSEQKRREYAELILTTHPQSQRHIEELRRSEGGVEGSKYGSGNAEIQKLLEEQAHGKGKAGKKSPSETKAETDLSKGLTALKKLEALMQSGTPTSIERALGESQDPGGKRLMGYVNPLGEAKDVRRGRTDMGVDFTAAAGSKISAIGEGVIDKILQGWTTYGRPGGQPLIEEQLTSGSRKGQFVYYAEQLNAAVKEGQRVTAGQRIGTVAQSGTGLEIGFGAGGGRTKAQATTGYSEGGETKAGQEFSNFLKGTSRTVAGGGLSSQGSAASAVFEQLIAKLKGEESEKGVSAAHRKALAELVSRLETVHRQALGTLVSELGTAGKEKEAAQFGVEATHIKDLSTDAHNANQKKLELAKDESTQTVDKMTTATQEITNAAAVMKDEMAAAAQALSDASDEITQSFSGQAQAVKESSDTRVAELQERGKYGLDLQAQREQVAIDQMKATYDAQIQANQIALDKAKTEDDALVAAKQLLVATTTAKEDALVAASRAAVDRQRIIQDQLVDTAQAKVGQSQLKGDNKIGQDQRRQIIAAVRGESKERQSALAAELKEDQELTKREVEKSTKGLVGAEDTRGKVLTPLENEAALTQATGEREIASANKVLTEVEGSTKKSLAQLEEALATLKGEASLKESAAEGKQAITTAEASTQYAGSGLVVNFTNIPSNDAVAIQSELGWLMRTQLPA